MKFKALVAVGVLSLLVPAHAIALGAGWMWPVSSATVHVGYGDRYESAGVSRLHHGMDVAASPGEVVVAPAAADVTFAGRIPSDDGTVLAVTLELATGERVTYLPLATAAVSRGGRVAPGGTVGTVAAGGDVSCASTHLHVGARSAAGDYMDPVPMFPVPALPVPSVPAVEPVPHEVRAQHPAADVVNEPTWAPGGVVVVGATSAVAQAPAGAAMPGVSVATASGLSPAMQARSGAAQPLTEGQILVIGDVAPVRAELSLEARVLRALDRAYSSRVPDALGMVALLAASLAALPARSARLQKLLSRCIKALGTGIAARGGR